MSTKSPFCVSISIVLSYPNPDADFSGCDGQHSRSDPGCVVLLRPRAHLDLGDLRQGPISLNLEGFKLLGFRPQTMLINRIA